MIPERQVTSVETLSCRKGRRPRRRTAASPEQAGVGQKAGVAATLHHQQRREHGWNAMLWAPHGGRQHPLDIQMNSPGAVPMNKTPLHRIVPIGMESRPAILRR